MLCLVFQLDRARYALDARHALAVLPYLPLQPVPQAPPALAGLFHYRGQPVPALDLAQLTCGRPAREWLSTRIILIQPPAAAGPPRLTGLIAEQATSTLRCDPAQFTEPALGAARAPYLGPVRWDEHGPLQLLHPEHLLAPATRTALGAGFKVEG